MWAHPTFKKGYKELLYSDTHHNFGLMKVVCSPDDTLIIGGGYHGKYVAWHRPSLKRTELIPSDETIEKLKPVNQSKMEGDKIVQLQIKPEVLEIEGERYLKNRGNHVSKIAFVYSGEYFVIHIASSNLLTIWDKNLQNISCEMFNGSIDFSNDSYLVEWDNTELVIYKNADIGKDRGVN